MTMYTAQIKKLIGREARYDTADFWYVCPFTPDELSERNRRAELVLWRHVGVTWHVLSGYTAIEAARAVGLTNHTTALYCIQKVHKLLEGSYIYDEMNDALEHVIQRSLGFPEQHDEPHVNELISLVCLENAKALPK